MGNQGVHSELGSIADWLIRSVYSMQLCRRTNRLVDRLNRLKVNLGCLGRHSNGVTRNPTLKAVGDVLMNPQAYRSSQSHHNPSTLAIQKLPLVSQDAISLPLFIFSLSALGPRRTSGLQNSRPFNMQMKFANATDSENTNVLCVATLLCHMFNVL